MENYVDITNRLPSKGLVYPDKTEINIRTFKGKDEKLIAEISSENFEKKFLLIMKSILKGIEISKLTLGDRMHIILWETINSYSKDYSVEHECEHCWKKSMYTVDLSKIDSIELPKEYKEPYEVKLPKSGGVIKLRLLRVEDVIKVDDMIKANQNVWLYRYALSIVNDKKVFENVEYLENLDTQDIMVIRGFHDKFNHGPKMEIGYECPNCGGKGVMPVPFRLEMLLPFGPELQRYIGNSV